MPNYGTIRERGDEGGVQQEKSREEHEGAAVFAEKVTPSCMPSCISTMFQH